MGISGENNADSKADGQNGLSPSEADLRWLACPVCHAALRLAGEGIGCVGCGREFPLVEGLPVLLADRARLPQ